MLINLSVLLSAKQIKLIEFNAHLTLDSKIKVSCLSMSTKLIVMQEASDALNKLQTVTLFLTYQVSSCSW